MDKQKLITRTLIGAGIVVLAYQLYKWGTKPKDPKIDQKKSNAEGKTTKGGANVVSANVNTLAKRDAYIKQRGYAVGERRYDKDFGKVFEFRNDDLGARWVLVADTQQPKTMEWYKLNNKWFWSDWKNKLQNYDGKKLNYEFDKYRLTLPEDRAKFIAQQKSKPQAKTTV
jgi:hypothetical protein